MKTAWKRGDRIRVARLAGISPQYMCDIIHGRKVARPELAIRLEAASKGCGYDIPRAVWVFRDLRKQFGDLFPNQ